MAEQGRGGGRALLFSQCRRPALNHNPAADRRSYGHVAMVSELLKRGARVDLPTRLGVTPLMAAAYYGHLSIVLRLLQHSADPDLQDIDGGTALMLAAGKGHEACVQALLRFCVLCYRATSARAVIATLDTVHVQGRTRVR